MDGTTAGGPKFPNLCYAEDTVLFVTTISQMEELKSKMDRGSHEFGFKNNRRKFRMMSVDHEHYNFPEVKEIAKCKILS